jgi:hypothetical protein
MFQNPKRKVGAVKSFHSCFTSAKKKNEPKVSNFNKLKIPWPMELVKKLAFIFGTNKVAVVIINLKIDFDL